MIKNRHDYSVVVEWTGNLGTGTSHHREYRREHLVSAGTKPPLLGSSDPAFRGDAARWNPEELLVVALSQCHMLWYLDLASRAGVVVLSYLDKPIGTMAETADGAGQFEVVTLRPQVGIAQRAMLDQAKGLHDAVHDKCFIARSVNFPVTYEPTHVLAMP